MYEIHFTSSRQFYSSVIVHIKIQRTVQSLH